MIQPTSLMGMPALGFTIPINGLMDLRTAIGLVGDAFPPGVPALMPLERPERPGFGGSLIMPEVRFTAPWRQVTRPMATCGRLARTSPRASGSTSSLSSLDLPLLYPSSRPYWYGGLGLRSSVDSTGPVTGGAATPTCC